MARAAKKEKVLTAVLVPEAEQPYPVPENWCWVPIYCINQYNSGSIDPAKAPNQKYELYSVPSSAENYPEIVEGEAIGSTKQEVEKNDVLLCKINPRINRVWKVSQYTEHTLLASSEWIIIRNYEMDANYLMYCFRSPYFREYMLSNVSGVGGSLMRAQPKYVKNYPIPIPPLAEQKRVVELLEGLFADLDAAKEKLTAVLDGFAERKAAVLHQAFTGKLTAGWRKEHGKHFSEWKTSHLEDCFDIVGGIQKQPSRKPDKNPVPYITVANVYRDKIDLADLRFFEVFDGELEKYQLKYGDILVVEGNGSGNEIGRCAMWRNELPVCIHQNHIIRVRAKDDSIHPEYVLYYLNSTMGNRIMKERARTTAGLYSLSTGKIKTILFPQAPTDEQKEIVRILDEIFDKEQQAQAAVEEVMEDIDALKKSILARAFRGELGTGNDADESATELLRRVL